MDFFHSLPLDLKLLVVAIAGCVLLALFSGNVKAEKRYVVVLAVLVAVGVYRFNDLPQDGDGQRMAETWPATQTTTAPRKQKPLESTSAVPQR